MRFSQKSLLCLKCRGRGHIASKCKQEYDNNFYDWFVSRQRAAFATERKVPGKRLCKRCSDLDLIHYLENDIPWKSAFERPNHPLLRKHIRHLGKAGTIRFYDGCSLCRCLFALTPTPGSDDQRVLMVPNWTFNRLEGGVALDTPEKRRCAKGILITLADGDDIDLSKDSILDRGDSLAILQNDLSQSKVALGARQIANTVDFNHIQQWLSRCSDLHPVTCTPMWSEQLRTVRLVDVIIRAVVPHPGSPCDYVALSYVMGDVKQIVCKPGSLPKHLPQTIEDSIDFVRKLGKQYLWVDTLCIDQSDSAEKRAQINKMDVIYRGAYATIVSLSGASAASGLPRFGRATRSSSQMSCRIGNKTLITLMPTLSQQIFTCRWGNRSWTLQEALLSRRCIYLSDQQVYFECNAMQCCETLDESHSWVHNAYRGPEFVVNGHSEAVVGAGVLRSPFTGSSTTVRNNRLEMYIVLTNLYNYRQMTYQCDALNAFSGIVQYLKEVAYPQGFFWGLPLEDFNWALSWVSRGAVKRRKGFPSWAWTGWQSRKWGGEVSDMRNPQKWTVFLRAFRLSDVGLLPLFSSEHHIEESGSQGSDTSPARDEDSLLRASRVALPDFEPSLCHESLSAQLLVIEGLTLTFRPDLSETYGYDEYGYVYWQQRINISLDDGTEEVRCLLRSVVHDRELDRLAQFGEPQSFLLLAQERRYGEVWFTLMVYKQVLYEEWEQERRDPHEQENEMIRENLGDGARRQGQDSDNVLMSRESIVHLVVPEEYTSTVMRALKPEKRRILLI